MTWIQRIVRRLRTLARLGSVESSMDREMRAHIEFETAARIAAGMSPDEARASALRDFGSLEALKEHGRDARGTRVFEDAARDVRYAVRSALRQPGPVVSAILTFALGVGAVTALFSVVHAVLVRPLPYPAPDRLVTIWETNPARGIEQNVASVATFEAWRDRVGAFDGIAGMVPAPVTLLDGDAPERVVGAEVSPAFFPVLGVAPLMGRTFTREDAAQGAVVVLSEALWRARFGARPDIVGTRIRIEGRPHNLGTSHEVIGVVSSAFEPPAYGWMARRQALWVPFEPSDDNRAYGRYLLVVGRLRPGVTIARAEDELQALSTALADERPAARGWSASVDPLKEIIVGDSGTALVYLLAAAGLLFVLAIANVATLLVARTRKRLYELGLRRALGATDRRLQRQLTLECLVLGTAGCAAGVALAYPLVAVLATLVPDDVPRTSGIALNLPVAAFAGLAGLAASIVISSVVARVGRRAPSLLLREASSRGSARRGGRALIAVEVALGLVIAVLAGLVIRSFVALRDVDLGFDPDRTLVARVALGAEYATANQQMAFFEELLANVRARPDVVEAGLVSGRPFGGIGPRTSTRDARDAASDDDPTVDVRWADSAFMRALRFRLVEGELFDGRDRPDGPVRTVITRSLARQLWPDEPAVGRSLALVLNGGIVATVTGVIDDIHLHSARTQGRPVVFLAPGRFGGSAYDLVVRTTGPPTAIVPDIRATLVTMDRALPLHRIDTLDAAVGEALARDRFTAILLASFGALALVLAGIGIYGVCAADVATRRKEIGIRMALGARAERVLLGVAAAALGSAAAGAAASLLVAAALATYMRTLLFGVAAVDPWSFAAATVSLLLVTLLATLIPAAHAARVSPLTALRE